MRRGTTSLARRGSTSLSNNGKHATVGHRAYARVLNLERKAIKYQESLSDHTAKHMQSILSAAFETDPGHGKPAESASLAEFQRLGKTLSEGFYTRKEAKDAERARADALAVSRAEVLEYVDKAVADLRQEILEEVRASVKRILGERENEVEPRMVQSQRFPSIPETLETGTFGRSAAVTSMPADAILAHPRSAPGTQQSLTKQVIYKMPQLRWTPRFPHPEAPSHGEHRILSKDALESGPQEDVSPELGSIFLPSRRHPPASTASTINAEAGARPAGGAPPASTAPAESSGPPLGAGSKSSAGWSASAPWASAAAPQVRGRRSVSFNIEP